MLCACYFLSMVVISWDLKREKSTKYAHLHIGKDSFIIVYLIHYKKVHNQWNPWWPFWVVFEYSFLARGPLSNPETILSIVARRDSVWNVFDVLTRSPPSPQTRPKHVSNFCFPFSVFIISIVCCVVRAEIQDNSPCPVPPATHLLPHEHIYIYKLTKQQK